jgi:signal transduction histidine kinase
MHWKEECLNMSIADDGIGFDPQNLDGSKHFGLDIMQERVYKVGGQIDVQSATGSGTEINISVPVLSLKKKGN